MEFDELFTKLKVNPLKLIESIVHADGSSVILFKNRKSEILYVNDQFYQKHPQFKNNKEAVIGKTDFDLFPDSQEHAKQAFEDEQRVMETGQAINVVETEGKNHDGYTIIAHTRKYPLYDSQGETIGVFVITEDMTSDVKALRENQEKAKILTKLNVELSQENATDALTQLYNRRFIHAELDTLQKDGAVSIARDIKDAFDHVILHAGAYHDIVRLSIGVAGIRDEETIQDLLNKCDQRMYISKRDGKHRITY